MRSFLASLASIISKLISMPVTTFKFVGGKFIAVTEAVFSTAWDIVTLPITIASGLAQSLIGKPSNPDQAAHDARAAEEEHQANLSKNENAKLDKQRTLREIHALATAYSGGQGIPYEPEHSCLAKSDYTYFGCLSREEALKLASLKPDELAEFWSGSHVEGVRSRVEIADLQKAALVVREVAKARAVGQPPKERDLARLSGPQKAYVISARALDCDAIVEMSPRELVAVLGRLDHGLKEVSEPEDTVDPVAARKAELRAMVRQSLISKPDESTVSRRFGI
ncbi:hypothetical protein ACELLULO517_15685 [Acidisoma cellulosilytica]|uniref:Uncharacterized protein n=1 Tax=Acidisoma cellulosilyticum TaxID=2802395 RepID=A0A963Z2T1_9PROT|nr:hypothetical protein [Acidisoma cellulosilyticum]MCB8881689.1 hypothetical protein [Acidisoma cellulosilyticum]